MFFCLSVSLYLSLRLSNCLMGSLYYRDIFVMLWPFCAFYYLSYYERTLHWFSCLISSAYVSLFYFNFRCVIGKWWGLQCRKPDCTIPSYLPNYRPPRIYSWIFPHFAWQLQHFRRQNCEFRERKIIAANSWERRRGGGEATFRNIFPRYSS